MAAHEAVLLEEKPPLEYPEFWPLRKSWTDKLPDHTLEANECSSNKHNTTKSAFGSTPMAVNNVWKLRKGCIECDQCRVTHFICVYGGSESDSFSYSYDSHGKHKHYAPPLKQVKAHQHIAGSIPQFCEYSQPYKGTFDSGSEINRVKYSRITPEPSEIMTPSSYLDDPILGSDSTDERWPLPSIEQVVDDLVESLNITSPDSYEIMQSMEEWSKTKSQIHHTQRTLAGLIADLRAVRDVYEESSDLLSLLQESLNDHLDNAKYLLERGANPNLLNILLSFLQIALRNKNKDIAKFLLERKDIRIDIPIPGANGEPELLIRVAEEWGDQDIICILKKKHLKLDNAYDAAQRLPPVPF